MVDSYPARYQDAKGNEQTIIENDGKRLRMLIRGVKFVGTDFDGLEPTLDPADPRLATFTLNGKSLCACHLECVLPLPVLVGQEIVTGRLQVYLELGHLRLGGNRGIDQETLRLCLSFGEPPSGLAEPAEPAEARLKMSCATSSKLCQKARISKHVSPARSPIIHR